MLPSQGVGGVCYRPKGLGGACYRPKGLGGVCYRLEGLGGACYRPKWWGGVCYRPEGWGVGVTVPQLTNESSLGDQSEHTPTLGPPPHKSWVFCKKEQAKTMSVQCTKSKLTLNGLKIRN